MSDNNSHQGSCLCRSVTYQITGDPMYFFVCHCNNCRKSSGSAFLSNAIFKPEQIVVTSGADTVRNYRDSETKTGKTMIRWFCPNCGSSLFLSGDDGKWKAVNVGGIDGDYTWLPTKEMFPEKKRQWVGGIHTKGEANPNL